MTALRGVRAFTARTCAYSRDRPPQRARRGRRARRVHRRRFGCGPRHHVGDVQAHAPRRHTDVLACASGTGARRCTPECADNVSHVDEIGDRQATDAAFAQADVGGAFGGRGSQAVEHRLLLWASKRLGRPVRWQAERSETLLSDEHARDNLHEAELALDANCRFVALRSHWIANVGAYVNSDRNFQASFQNTPGMVGVYDFPAAHVRFTCVMSHTMLPAPYRGAGRPEATYVVERLIDDAARELKLDPVTLRRRNLHRRRRHAAQDPLALSLRLRRVRAQHGPGARDGRLERLRRAARGSPRQGLAARYRAHQPDRAGCGARTRIRRDPLRCARQGHRAHGQQEPGPGSRDDVQADPRDAPWAGAGRHPLRRRRHRSRRLRRRHVRIALCGHRRLGAVDRRAQDRRQGRTHRRAGHRVRGRPLQRRRHRSRV